MRSNKSMMRSSKLSSRSAARQPPVRPAVCRTNAARGTVGVILMTLINRTIENYEVISKIGEGGMGEVYRARDTKLGRDVAIKVLPAALSADAERLRRFEQEAQAAGALNHPNILVIFHIGMHDGAPYIVS